MPCLVLMFKESDSNDSFERPVDHSPSIIRGDDTLALQEQSISLSAFVKKKAISIKHRCIRRKSNDLILGDLKVDGVPFRDS